MQNLDIIIIYHQTDGDTDAELTNGIAALYERTSRKGHRVYKVGFSKTQAVNSPLPAAGLPDKPRVGIYAVGHAGGIPGFSYSFPELSAEQFSNHVAELLRALSEPQLVKVVLLGCAMARAEVAAEEIPQGNGSYLQKFCHHLNKDHDLTPKVAGWDGYVSILPSGDDMGRKTVTPPSKDFKAPPPGPVKPSSRTKHKLCYVCEKGTVVKLALAEWSDKPVT